MRKYRTMSFLIVIMLSLISTINIYAVGDGNIDSGGGGLGQGTGDNVWSSGNEGVRVTVVRSVDHAIVTTPIDISNKPAATSIFNFGKVCKIQYNNGKALTPVRGGYVSVKPTQAIPKIVSSNGQNNIAAIKSYFTDEQVIRSIAVLTGMNYDILINGDYKLLLEPMAYYKFEGVMIATTATEAAMYDQVVSGLLREKMASLTHKNLPLSMFLEVSDLGYPAWNGSRTSSASDADIKSSLGIGVVRFKSLPEVVPVNTYDYEYRTDTDVVTAVMVSGGQSDPSNPCYVSFNIGGTSYNVGNVFYPNGDSQLTWVKWHTPSTEQVMDIQVSSSGTGNTSKSFLRVKLVDLDKNPPPNPVADDRNDSFASVPVPARAEKTRADWSVWRPWWQSNWVDEGYWSYSSWKDSKGKVHTTSTWIANWIDRGWWRFDLNTYYATLSATMTIKCDSKNPTAVGRTMKSGYGINESVTAIMSSNQSSAITYPQHAVSYFPEFQYKTFWRVLERLQSGSFSEFEFSRNPYSTYHNRTHFTPIWMPDGNYEVNTWLIDAWTPSGMLSMNLTDKLTIKGNLWSDWHISPLNP